MAYNPYYRNTAPQTNGNAPMMLPEPSDVVSMLKEAVGIGARGMMFHGAMSRLMHSMGFHGDKRLHRYEAHNDADYMMCVQHFAIDLYDANLEPELAPWPLDAVMDMKNALETYLAYEQDTYKRICNLANRLIAAEYLTEAHLVKKNVECVTKEIEKIYRRMKEYEQTEWEMEYILLADKVRHDKYKKKESEAYGWGD